jgi:hypothetical protein
MTLAVPFQAQTVPASAVAQGTTTTIDLARHFQTTRPDPGVAYTAESRLGLTRLTLDGSVLTITPLQAGTDTIRVEARLGAAVAAAHVVFQIGQPPSPEPPPPGAGVCPPESAEGLRDFFPSPSIGDTLSFSERSSSSDPFGSQSYTGSITLAIINIQCHSGIRSYSYEGSASGTRTTHQTGNPSPPTATPVGPTLVSGTFTENAVNRMSFHIGFEYNEADITFSRYHESPSDDSLTFVITGGGFGFGQQTLIIRTNGFFQQGFDHRTSTTRSSASITRVR